MPSVRPPPLDAVSTASAAARCRVNNDMSTAQRSEYLRLGLREGYTDNAILSKFIEESDDEIDASDDSESDDDAYTARPDRGMTDGARSVARSAPIGVVRPQPVPGAAAPPLSVSQGSAGSAGNSAGEGTPSRNLSDMLAAARRSASSNAAGNTDAEARLTVREENEMRRMNQEWLLSRHGGGGGSSGGGEGETPGTADAGSRLQPSSPSRSRFSGPSPMAPVARLFNQNAYLRASQAVDYRRVVTTQTEYHELESADIGIMLTRALRLRDKYMERSEQNRSFTLREALDAYHAEKGPRSRQVSEQPTRQRESSETHAETGALRLLWMR